MGGPQAAQYLRAAGIVPHERFELNALNAIAVGVMLITLITFACAAVVATVRGSIGVRSTPQAPDVEE